MRFSVLKTDVIELGCHKPDWGHLPHSLEQVSGRDVVTNGVSYRNAAHPNFQSKFPYHYSF